MGGMVVANYTKGRDFGFACCAMWWRFGDVLLLCPEGRGSEMVMGDALAPGGPGVVCWVVPRDRG